jgi:methionyl-tRNA formyltransferase
MDNKIAFFLMTSKGFYVLQRYLLDFGTSNIDCIIVARDRNIMNDYFEEIVALCEKEKIPYYERNSDIKLKCDYAISISWRWIIRNKVKIVVLHDSLLPKYRGFSPLVNSLINKEKKIGVTALFAVDEYDKGDIITQKGISVNYPLKIQDAIGLLLPIYYDWVKEVVTKIINSLPLEANPQDEQCTSYSLWRDEYDYKINWLWDSDYIKRFIDAVGEPYSGAYSFIGERKVRILNAQEEIEVPIQNRTPGKIIFIKNGEPVIVCGKGLLRIEKMIDDETRNDLIPMAKFRVRFR